MKKVLTRYWSRVPGKFVDRHTGISPDMSEWNGPTFAGSVREWCETLVETCWSLHSKTNREANALIASQDIIHLLEQTCVFISSCDDDNEQNFFLVKVGNFPFMGLSVYQDGSDDFIRLVDIDKKTSSIEEIAQLNILDLHFI